MNCTKNLGLARTNCCASTDDDGIVVGSSRMGVSHRLRVDCSERNAALLKLASECGDFEVSVVRLRSGDYLVDDCVLVERKTYADFATSLADGRLFPQAAALARSPHRPVILLEGPKPDRMPDVHPHSLKGAMVSLAVMWRLPLLYARDAEDSLLILRLLAQQAGGADGTVLKRYDRKPKRLASRKLHILQGFPGIGPQLARRLLARFGSVERVLTADERALTAVRGMGPRKAERMRALMCDGDLELATLASPQQCKSVSGNNLPRAD